MTDNKWARLLAYVSGLVNQKLLLQNEYLAAENRIYQANPEGATVMRELIALFGAKAAIGQTGPVGKNTPLREMRGKPLPA
jgi:hypothetical protein